MKTAETERGLAELLRSLAEVKNTLRQLERRIDEDIPRQIASNFQAIEALVAVYRVMDSRPALPEFARPGSGWAISPELARLAIEQILVYRPSMIVEFGSGTSTHVFAQIAKDLPGTRIVSFEHDSLWYANTLVELSSQGLDNVDLRYAPLVPTEIQGQEFLWYDKSSMTDLSEIDFVVVDGPPGHVGPEARYPTCPMLESKCAPGCVWIVDDTIREDEKNMVKRWIREFNLELLLEQTWNGKGATVLRTPSER
jgi:hypothetical protein